MKKYIKFEESRFYKLIQEYKNLSFLVEHGALRESGESTISCIKDLLFCEMEEDYLDSTTLRLAVQSLLD